MRSAYILLYLVILTSLSAAESPMPPRPVMDQAGNLRPRQQAPAAPDNTPATSPAASSKSAKGSSNETKRPISAANPGDQTREARTGPAPEAIEHDTVILHNEQRFLGTVLASQDDPDWVAINTGSGIMRLKRESVARVEFGLTARMGRVKPDDLDGLIDLARWCRANARNPQALALLTKAVALPGCDLATRGLYAQLVDEQDGADKALPLYLAYRNAGGTDAEILARLNELETAHSAWEEQMRALGLDPGASAAAGSPMASATASSVEEGYEKYKWDPDSLDWSSPAKPTLVTLVTPEGPRRVMQVDVEPHPSKPNVDKAAIVLRRPLTLREGSKLTLLAANRGKKDLRLGIAVKTGNEWTYFESKPQVVPSSQSGQEFTQLFFDLGAADFKAQSTNWSYGAKISNLGQVRELQLLIHNGTAAGSLWIAGIAFEGASE